MLADARAKPPDLQDQLAAAHGIEIVVDHALPPEAKQD